MNLYETTLSTSSTPSIRSSVYRAGIDRPPCDDLGISPADSPRGRAAAGADGCTKPQTQEPAGAARRDPSPSPDRKGDRFRRTPRQGKGNHHARGHAYLCGQVQRHDPYRAENACCITTLAPSKTQVLAERVGGRVLRPLDVVAAVSVSTATAPLANTCPTPAACALLVVTGTPKRRRVAGSYGSEDVPPQSHSSARARHPPSHPE